jgi:hypothetical protein
LTQVYAGIARSPHPDNEGKANSVDPMVNSGRSIGYHNDLGAPGPLGLTNVGKRATPRRRKGPVGGPFHPGMLPHTSITVDPPLSPHELQSVSRTPRRELPTSNATRTRPHTAFADTSHCYAQRHADAGVPIDVLAELLDHRSYSMTRRYYRIGEDRRRDAVDAVTALSFDRHGNRIWRDAHMLLESERARHAVGEVTVPYGTCTEPTNVKAGGGACPVRYRCVGCDHFRTNVAFLPELQAYLDDLLRTRERLAATVDFIDDWARADATPTEEEVTRVRRLINRIKADVADLDDTEQARIDDAVAIVRRHRAAHTVPLGMPSLNATPPAPTTIASEATA